MIPGFASWPEFAYKVRADDLDHERAKKDAYSVVVARTPPLKADAWHGARGLSVSCKIVCSPCSMCSTYAGSTGLQGFRGWNTENEKPEHKLSGTRLVFRLEAPV